MNSTSLISRGWLRRAHHLAHPILDATLPQTCAGCQMWIPASAGVLCPTCSAELDRMRDVGYCARCGRNTPPVGAWTEGCRGCRTERYWNIAEIVRIGDYDGALRSMILRLKYSGEERNALILGELLARAIGGRSWAHELDALVPVPMHWVRRLQRPCDHARLIAEAVARHLRVKVCRIARRPKPGPSQTRMESRAERFENVRGCFGISGRSILVRDAARALGLSAFDLPGKTVCIVDNLATSGATIHEIAKVLRRAGARRIYAAVVARAAFAGSPESVTLEEALNPGVALRA